MVNPCCRSDGSSHSRSIWMERGSSGIWSNSRVDLGNDMSKFIFTGVLFGLAVVCNSQSPTAKVDDISWLAGCWERLDPKGGLQIREQWMKPAGGTMFGTGRTVKNGKTVDYEFTRSAVRQRIVLCSTPRVE